MPRYAIDDEAAGLLARYLATLAAAPVPGLTGSTVRFATVVLPDADRASTDAMLAVLRAFFADKNGATRNEARRRATGSEWMYEGYRAWHLDVWELHGPPEGWTAQLEERYRAQPVFALVSGIGNARWEPVDAFCERFEVPCVLPNALEPGQSPGFYAVHYARGTALEGEVLARHLEGARAPAAPVVQVYRMNGIGRNSAQALRERLPGRHVVDVPLDESAGAASTLRAALATQPSPCTLVLWLADADLADVASAADLVAGASATYVAARLASIEGPVRSGIPIPGMRVVYPFDLPQERARRLARARVWFDARGVARTDERIQSNTFFAAMLVGDALGHLANVPSRDYFLERIEHMAESLPNTSSFPRISLAPGQRFASKGAYVVEPRQPGQPMASLGGWIVP